MINLLILLGVVVGIILGWGLMFLSQKEKESLYLRQQKEFQEAQQKALIDLKDTFKALSADALRENAPEFLRLANESFLKFQETAKGDLAQKQEAISGLIKPLQEQLNAYQIHLRQTEVEQSKVLGAIGEQLSKLTQESKSLANETEQFRQILRSNQARGRWGEETLRRVVEAAGMSALCDFEEQTQAEDKKPDMIVRLPEDRMIIVDAKVPDLDFMTALETADIETRKKSLRAHAASLKETIKALAKKDYPSQFPNALDYVVLFLPAESLFSAALEGDQELIVWAAKQKIMLATPASLMALLRSVSMSWQQFSQTQNVKQIAEAAQEFYRRVVVFSEHLERIGKGISQAQKSFNDAMGSYEKRIIPAGETLASLGLKTEGKALADIKPIEGDCKNV